MLNPQCPLNRRMGWLSSQSGHDGEERTPCLWLKPKPSSPGLRLLSYLQTYDNVSALLRALQKQTFASRPITEREGNTAKRWGIREEPIPFLFLPLLFPFFVSLLSLSFCDVTQGRLQPSTSMCVTSTYAISG